MTTHDIKASTASLLNCDSLAEFDDMTEELLAAGATGTPPDYDQDNPKEYFGHYMRYRYDDSMGEFCYFFSTGDPLATAGSCGKGYSYLLPGSLYGHDIVGDCKERDKMFRFRPKDEKPGHAAPVRLIQTVGENKLEYEATLTPGDELKLCITTLDRQPAVGILDVIHQTPNVRGSGNPVITWREALEWGAGPNSPGDMWNKICTIKNNSRSAQPCIIRFFFLN